MEQNETTTTKAKSPKCLCRTCKTPKIKICPNGHSGWTVKRQPKIVTFSRRWYWRIARFFFLAKRKDERTKAEKREIAFDLALYDAAETSASTSGYTEDDAVEIVRQARKERIEQK